MGDWELLIPYLYAIYLSLNFYRTAIDNYDAINVGKTTDIPCDYEGYMGVPITFLDKYSPNQFEIIWQACGNTRASAPLDILKELNYESHPEDRGGCGVINGKRQYARVIIRNKHPRKI